MLPFWTSPFSLSFLNWSLVDLKYCVNFRYYKILNIVPCAIQKVIIGHYCLYILCTAVCILSILSLKVTIYCLQFFYNFFILFKVINYWRPRFLPWIFFLTSHSLLVLFFKNYEKFFHCVYWKCCLQPKIQLVDNGNKIMDRNTHLIIVTGWNLSYDAQWHNMQTGHVSKLILWLNFLKSIT